MVHGGFVPTRNNFIILLTILGSFYHTSSYLRHSVLLRISVQMELEIGIGIEILVIILISLTRAIVFSL